MNLFSGIILAQPEASQLYFLARSKDSQGAGWLRLSIKYLMNFFNKSKSTILRWARNVFYFQDSEVRGDRIFLKYKAIGKVKKDSVVPAHAKFNADESLLKDLNQLKAKCYEAAIVRQQQSCRKAVEKVVKSSKQTFEPTLESLQSSKIAKGCEWVDKDGTKAFVKRHVVPIGARQQTVAEKVGRSAQTLRKHTKTLKRVYVWWRVYYRNPKEGIPAHYYQFNNKKVRNGKASTEKRLYRRMPNYYFCDVYASPEKTKEVFVPVSPTEQLDEKRSLIKMIVSQMPKRRKVGVRGDLCDPKVQKKFLEKLLDVPKNRIDLIAVGFFMYANGGPDSKETREMMLGRLKEVSVGDLIDKIGNTLSLLKSGVDDRLADYLLLLLRRALKSDWVIPPLWETYRTTGYSLSH